MNKNPVNINKHICRLECSDYCGEFQITYWEGDKDILLSYHIPKFYNDSIGEIFKNKIKMIWAILMNKEYILYELNLDTKKEVEVFKTFVANINTDNLYYDE